MQRLLVVDDDDGIRECVRDILVENGYEVDIALDGNEALAMILRDPRRYSLVLLDLKMPGLDGLEVIRAVERRGLEVPILIMSATRPVAMTKRPYLSKPFDINDLLREVRRCGEEAQASL